MSEQGQRKRAEAVAQMSPNASVTVPVLADEGHDRGTARLAGPPPVSYLEECEAPAFVLTNEKRGIGLGAKRNRTTPGEDRGTVVLVTGRRTLCLVGVSPDDVAIEIPHEEVATVTYHTGLLANRLELRTPQQAYHCWVDRTADRQLLAETASYIEERSSSDDESEGDSKVMYRGHPVDSSYLK